MSDLEKASWLISDLSIIILFLAYFGLISISGSIGLGFLSVGTYREAVIVVGGIGAIVSYIFKII